MGCLMPKLVKEEQRYYSTYMWSNKWIHAFSDGISPKVNVIVRQEFELVTPKPQSSISATTLFGLIL